MNKMRHALALVFLVSLMLGAMTGSAAADPVESDTSNLPGSGFQSVKSRFITVGMKIKSARLVLTQPL